MIQSQRVPAVVGAGVGAGVGRHVEIFDGDVE